MVLKGYGVETFVNNSTVRRKANDQMMCDPSCCAMFRAFLEKSKTPKLTNKTKFLNTILLLYFLVNKEVCVEVNNGRGMVVTNRTRVLSFELTDKTFSIEFSEGAIAFQTRDIADSSAMNIIELQTNKQNKMQIVFWD